MNVRMIKLIFYINELENNKTEDWKRVDWNSQEKLSWPTFRFVVLDSQRRKI